MKKYLLVMCVLAFVLSACSSGSKSDSLVGKWKLTSYGPAETQTSAVPDVDATIEFGNDGKVSGNSGCNGFGGTYEIKDAQIAFSAIVSTLMACDDPRMAQENAVFQVLKDNVDYKIDGKTLTLTKDKMILVFSASQ